MPRKPSDGILGLFKKSQKDVMGDLCNIIRVTTMTGTYSDDEVSSVTGTFSIPCGFHFTNGQIRNRNQVLLVDYEVVMRLPVTEEIEMSDRIELVEKGDVPVSGTFMPYELPQVGATAIIVNLKRTT